ncbi:CD2 antigen cytoplasmic tail-binding protein 2 [Chamberlinius hualienensis]
MSKRKFDQISVESSVVEEKKHTLDSDEEDDDSKKYEIMEDDDVEGQEDETIDYDGDIKITPFNIKEELEEGHFDKDGNYFLNKEEEIRDSWLDNIDWVKVKAQEKPLKEGGLAESESDDEDDDPAVNIDECSVVKQIIELMKPGETILRAIRRLGNKSSSSASASSRWLKNKKKLTQKQKDKNLEQNPDEAEEQRKKMLALTEMADKLLSRGRTEIYSETYEKLKHQIESKNRAETSEPLDMFGDDFPEKEKVSSEPKPGTSQTDDENKKNYSNAILWEFKWEKEPEAKVYGPHTTDEMQSWVSEGYFNDGVWVRRADETDAQFYSSKRIDFELYL